MSFRVWTREVQRATGPDLPTGRGSLVPIASQPPFRRVALGGPPPLLGLSRPFVLHRAPVVVLAAHAAVRGHVRGGGNGRRRRRAALERLEEATRRARRGVDAVRRVAVDLVLRGRGVGGRRQAAVRSTLECSARRAAVARVAVLTGARGGGGRVEPVYEGGGARILDGADDGPLLAGRVAGQTARAARGVGRYQAAGGRGRRGASAPQLAQSHGPAPPRSGVVRDQTAEIETGFNGPIARPTAR